MRRNDVSRPCRDIMSRICLQTVNPLLESCCDWGTGTVRERRGKGKSAVRSRHQERWVVLPVVCEYMAQHLCTDGTTCHKTITKETEKQRF